MLGTDEIDDDGLIDTWACDSTYYTCTAGTNQPDQADRTDNRDYENFIPITPTAIHIDELHFYLAPIEDPFKAFAEDSALTFEHVQIHPNVIISIEASYVESGVVGPSITMQTSISTGVYSKTTTANSA